ncbi:IS110 family transposase [Nonomuraea sp. NPDC059023]|uniref:IS110 family transposase n=1 Tax=unclassified Nonomuraea TaxID=2593643 RepID=UPI0036C0A294
MPDDATSSHHHDDESVVLGVDTHKDTHVAAVITISGRPLGSRSFPTTTAGYHDLLTWASALGILRRAGVEGTSSYGTALTRHLHAAGIQVLEVNQPDKAERRRRGKTDEIDAETAARAVLSGRATATAKTSDGPVEMIRLFKTAKESATKSRAQAINQLKAILVRADPVLREQLTGLSNPKLIRCCAGLTTSPITTARAAAAHTLRSPAQRIIHLTDEINELNTQITEAINSHRPQLLDCYGVGPDTAAALLIVAGDNPERLASEASFAALCGVSPIEASSGKTQRHRLNRGGDRRANSALYTIVIARLRWCTRTRGYIMRRQAEGKTRREAIRCLKRYIAREIHKIIMAPRRA